MAYEVTSLDCAADGMERIRNQSESILLCYPGQDWTAADCLAELKSDLDSVMRAESFDFYAARQAIQAWYDDGGESSLAAELAAEQWDSFGEDESPVYRLYLDVESEEESA